MTEMARNLGTVHTHTHTHTHTQVVLNKEKITNKISAYLSGRVFAVGKNYARDG